MKLDKYDRACMGFASNCVRCGKPMPEPEDSPRECPALTTRNSRND